jgi:hypothetical protein
MKMKTVMKKCGLVAVCAAALFMVVALVIGCPTPGSGIGAPTGMGTIRLNFNDEVSRTVMPGTLTTSSFPQFEFIFTATEDGDNKIISDRTFATLNDAVVLVPGTYDLKVNAYLTAGTPPSNLAATSGTVTGIPITTNGNTTRIITLAPIIDGVGTGLFAWTIDCDSMTPTPTIKMTIKDLGGDFAEDLTDPGDPIEIDGITIGLTSTGIPIYSGYYYVDLTVTSGPDSKDFHHVLHIYQNMTSTFEYEFTDLHLGILSFDFKASSVEYVHPENFVPVLNDGINDLASGEKITLALGDPDADPIPIPPGTVTITVTNAYDSIAWYSDGSAPLETGDEFEITAGVAPFDSVGLHHLTVVGVSNGIPYDTYIVIEITE